MNDWQSAETTMLFSHYELLQELKSVLLRVGSQLLYVECQTKIFIVIMSCYDSDFFVILKSLDEIGFGKNRDR